MSKSDDNQRLLREIALFGGEKMFAEWSPADRELWHKQTMVLSHLRETGDMTQASLRAGVEPIQAFGWEEKDTLGFAERAINARREKGYSMVGTLIEKLEKAKSINASAWKVVLGHLLPQEFGTEADMESKAGVLLFEALKNINAERKELQEQAGEIEEAKALLGPTIELPVREVE